jgi:hypothetical protein
LENQEKVFAIARIVVNIVSMVGTLRRLLGFQVSYLGSIVSWPVLLVADVCMT